MTPARIGATMCAMVSRDDVTVGVGWVLGGRRPGITTAQRQIQDRFGQESDRDLERARQRRAEMPDPPPRWRFSAGAWQRWSVLEGEFRDAPAPGLLVEQVEAAGGPVEGQVLELVDGRWQPESPEAPEPLVD